MSAAKFYDDSFYNNEIYARIGGVLPEELNDLELEFMFLINFTLTISQNEFYRYYCELYSHCDSICSSCCRFFIIRLIVSTFTYTIFRKYKIRYIDLLKVEDI